MRVEEKLTDFRHTLDQLRQAGGGPLALIPTMGALHDGHISLVQRAMAEGCTPIATIFVNPTQFAAHEDLDTYPSTLDQDLDQLARAGTKCVWTPPVAEVYPGADYTRVSLKGDLTGRWEGAFRPHFFEGVATVVTKLFNAARPDVAYFGEKDFQQLAVIRAMVQDLLLPIEVRGSETVRAADGLALSSRNSYLSAQERQRAPALYATMQTFGADIRAGIDIQQAEAAAHRHLLSNGFASIDYLVAVDAHSLEPLDLFDGQRPARILAAAYCGKTRLIDNIAI